jgi:H+/Cl- antiporter ClcA
MVSLFCGVTNCPITALILGIELFGSTPAGYLLLAVAISYVFSGDNGLYEAQTLVYERDRVRFSHPQVHGREDK